MAGSIDNEDRSTACCLGITCGSIALVLSVILIPMTFGYVEYYEYGLSQRKTTGSVNVERVYDSGRYAIGPDYKFLKYQADAHIVNYDSLSVFSAPRGSNESIGLEFLVDVDFTYFLIEDQIGNLHKELARNYRTAIDARAKDAIKNSAVTVTFTEYFQERKSVEEKFRQAVEERWTEPPALHCTLDQFHLGRIQIPESVATKQLESRIQIERNDLEEFVQQAQVERQLTDVEVNAINLEREKVLRTVKAEASFIRSKALSTSDRIKAQAQTNGTKLLLDAASITSQEHKSAFAYIRTLKNRDDRLHMGVSYLPGESVLRTAPAAASTTSTTTATDGESAVGPTDSGV